MRHRIFGTDGIRSAVNTEPMTVATMTRLGHVLADHVPADGCVLIGKDTRQSGDMFERALVDGLVFRGVDVTLVGILPTPGIAFLTRSMKASVGIVISASHNPFTDNGIKLFDSDGFKFDDAKERAIEQALVSSETYQQATTLGVVYDDSDALDRYVSFCKETQQSMTSEDKQVPSASLAGIKIVIDCAHGASFLAAPCVFRELGAHVIAINNIPNGKNINAQCGAVYPQNVCEQVVKHKASVGIALDGDGDRLILCDERGVVVDGDAILAICAIQMKLESRLTQNTIVTTVMSNLGLDRVLETHGIGLIKTNVGDRFVAEQMKQHDLALGGEQSGHLIFSEFSTTGDGIIAALQVITTMMITGKILSSLSSVIRIQPQILINVDVSHKQPIDTLPKVQEAIASAEQVLQDSGRVFVRYSGTELKARVMLEGDNLEQIKVLAERIAESFTKPTNED